MKNFSWLTAHGMAMMLFLNICATAQTNGLSRPRPYPVFETPGFARAVKAGTRTRSGQPGAKYWQQFARYHIEAELDPITKKVAGKETIRYFNHSPDTLYYLAVYLRQNVFKPDAVRNTRLPLTDGMQIKHIAVNGAALTETKRNNFEAGFTIEGTIAWLRLPQKLMPKDSLVIAFEWSYTPPLAPGDGRQGQDGEVFFMGYWYPQLAVYDDVSGWVTDPYLSMSEFYMGYADYDVRLTAPQNWLVAATGTLQNPNDVLSPAAQARLAEALRSDKVVAVVTEQDREQAFRLSGNAVNTWHYRATNIRDFAWASSNRYLWDATRALVGPPEKQKVVAIHNFYRAIPEASAWVHGARYNRMATEFLSRFLWPYPYPQMTSVEGILDGGGMEYPMMTVIQSYKDTLRLAGNLMHEIGHMWFPMNVGSDENRYPWQDEGLTQFNSAVGVRELFGYDRGVSGRETYLYTARRGREVELMRHGNFFPAQDVYYALPYNKTSNILFALRAVLGEEVFMRAYREYGQRWRNKHPQPHDFFNTFNEVAGRDLSWFWRTWFYETWTLDQAIASVQTVGDSVEILVEDRGLAPMPVQLMITREGGQTESREIPVEIWLAGAQRHTVRVSKTPALTRIEIDAENNFPDIDRTNQVWQK